MVKRTQNTEEIQSLTPRINLEGFRNRIKDELKKEFGTLIRDSILDTFGAIHLKELEAKKQAEAHEEAIREENRQWVAEMEERRKEELRDPTLFVNEASKLIGVSPQTMIAWAKKGKIKHNHTKGMAWSFKTSDVLASKHLIRKQNPNLTRAWLKVCKEVNDDQSDQYLTPLECFKRNLIPFDQGTLRKHIKHFKHKKIKLNKKEIVFVSVNSIKEVLKNPPWIKQGRPKKKWEFIIAKRNLKEAIPKCWC